MFGYLKNKLKDAVNKFSNKVEEEGKEEEIPVEQPSAEAPAEAEPADEAAKKKKVKAAKEPTKESVKEPKKKTTKEAPAKKTVEATSVYEEPERVVNVQPEKKGIFKRMFGRKTDTLAEAPETEVEAKTHGVKEPKSESQQATREEKGFLGKLTQKITAKEITEAQFDDIFWEMEIALLENNVAMEVIEKIKEDLKTELVGKPIKRTQITQTIIEALKKSVEDLFVQSEFDFLREIKKKKPYVVCFVGINGSGKTTSIAKVARLLQEEGLSVVLAAADTFRAAAIDQLQEHANNLGVKLIRQDYGSDPAAVAYDAVQHAKSKGIDAVLIDTAGRMHSNVNLLDEMRKIVRVAQPDMNIFVGESITGNDCVEQAKQFNDVITLDGIILSKADVDEKGGAALSVSYVTGKPILFLGVGQEYQDLQKFKKEVVLDNLGL